MTWNEARAGASLPVHPGRLLSYPLWQVLRGAAGMVDAHSIDVYAYSAWADGLGHYYDITGVPWILAEALGFRSEENLSGNPNTVSPICSVQMCLTYNTLV